MKCILSKLVVFSLLAVGLTAPAHADGLIKKLPPSGHWSSYDVETSITHPDGSQTNSTGILTVRALGSTEIEGKPCRWLEFEFSWKQEPTEKNSRRFHSSITKVAIDESVFVNNTDPIKGIHAGFGAKKSANEQPEEWNYQRPHMLKPGVGSTSGFGALDHYLRLPFDRSIELGREKIDVGDLALECIGVESSETNHKIGSNRKTVTSTAYQQWSCDETNFGVVKYHFERLVVDGTSFSQKLTLKESGENAETSLPESE